MSFSLNDIPRIAPNVTFRLIGEEVFIMHLVSLRTCALNSTASAVWRQVDGVRTAGEIAERVMEEFEIDPEDCRSAVLDVLDRLRMEELLHPAEPHD